MKYFICKDLGCVYRLNKGYLEYAPTYGESIIFDSSEFVDVEEELVGKEPIKYRGKDMKLKELYKIVKKHLA